MLVFSFDQDLTSEDVIQDSSGLRFTTMEGTVYTSANVTRRDARTLSATYDLPPGTTVGDAVSGFVTQGTVQGTNGQPTSTPINRSIRTGGGSGGGGTQPTVAPTAAPTEDLGAPRNIREGNVTPVPREIR
jgi:hypothetical protein